MDNLYTGKTVEDAITNGCMALELAMDSIEYEVIDKGSTGLLGIGSKPAKVQIWEKGTRPVEEKEEVKEEIKEEVKASVESSETKEETVPSEKKNVSNEEIEKEIRDFLGKVFTAMGLNVNMNIEFNEEEVYVNMGGDDMGTLIGKRGQTLDSLQYLVSLVVNKKSADYIRIKLDTENYRERRKETLENLAKNIAYKVSRTKRPVSLEPMNPYERRIIHSALQNDKYVTTKSEGEEPYRHVVVIMKNRNN